MNLTVVNVLVAQVRRIEVETELGAVCPLTASMARWAVTDVKGDFGRMDFQAEINVRIRSRHRKGSALNLSAQESSKPFCQ